MNKNIDKSFFQPSQLHRNGNLSPIRPRQKMPTIYRHKMQRVQQTKDDSFRWPKDNSYLKKRFNKQIEMERSEMLMKTGTSYDNPQWMAVNFDHYRRDSQVRPHRHSLIQQRTFDVFNNPKKQFEGRNQDSYFLNMINSSETTKQEVARRTGYESFFRSPLNNSLMLQPEVALKVGTSDKRDYSIPRPLLKIGNNSFVDTYTPF